MNQKLKIIVLTEDHGKVWWEKYTGPYCEHNKIILDIENIHDANLSFFSLKTFMLFLKLVKGYLFRYRNYDIVITFQHYLSTICVGMLNSAVDRGNKKHIVLQFNRKDGDDDIGARLKDYLLRLSLRSTARIICHSKDQITSYSEKFLIPKERFRYIPLCVDPKLFDLEKVTESDYILSAGKTSRDYSVLVKAAGEIGVKVIIIGDDESVAGLKIPPNVTVLIDLPYWEYIHLMVKSRFVVVPLQDKKMSMGQSVIQAAMALGKAVVATKTSATVDYILDNVTGFLVEPKNDKILRETMVELLNNPKRVADIGRAARGYAKTNFSIQGYLETLMTDIL